MSKPLSHLGGLTAEQFLNEYWQKKPLLVRGAFPEIADLLTPEDLQELSMEDGVEARLIQEKGKTPWELRQGPFTEKDFKGMPKSHWTLLVQAVDHYFPALSEYLDEFNFIPSWRVDDVMISYAPQGGSVGPHYDRYDVFLIQGKGQRRWQLGPFVDEHTPRQPHASLRLLAEMPVEFDEILNPGDMLYVPPFLAHNGVAENDCMTYSIGFRAPHLSNLLECVIDTALERSGVDVLYTDPDLKADSENNGKLTSESLASLRRQMMKLLESENLFAEVCGQTLSEPKYDDYEPQGEELSSEEISEAIANGAFLVRDPASRYLYLEIDGKTRVYINGEEQCPENNDIPFLVMLCNRRILPPSTLGNLSEAALKTAERLVSEGLLLLIENED